MINKFLKRIALSILSISLICQTGMFAVAVEDNANNAASISISALPDIYDSQLENFISPIENEETDTTSWAFASLDALETTMAKANRGEYDFSEAHLAQSFAKNSLGTDADQYGMYNDALTGATYRSIDTVAANPLAFANPFLYSAAYLLRDVNNGPVVETSYDNSKINSASNTTDLNNAERVPIVSDVIQCPYTYDTRLSADNKRIAIRNWIKKAVYEQGAAVINLRMSDGDGFNKLDVTNQMQARYCDFDVEPNYSVTVVGWDNSYSKTNFNIQPAGDGAFICKSNGIINGYFYLSYYDNASQNQAMYYANVRNLIESANVYGNDTLPTNVTTKIDTRGFGSIFTSKNNYEIVTSVMLDVQPEFLGKNYKIKIGRTAQEALKSEPLAKGKFALDSIGYISVQLNEPYPVGERDTKFYVLCQFDSSVSTSFQYYLGGSVFDSTTKIFYIDQSIAADRLVIGDSLPYSGGTDLLTKIKAVTVISDDRPFDFGIDYTNTDALHLSKSYNFYATSEILGTPSATATSLAAESVYIDFNSEKLYIPKDAKIVAYSVNGKWKTASIGDYDGQNISKIIRRGGIIQLATQFSKRAKKPIVEKDVPVVIWTFGKILPRPENPKVSVNYGIYADESGKTSGRWTLSEKKGMTERTAGLYVAHTTDRKNPRRELTEKETATSTSLWGEFNKGLRVRPIAQGTKQVRDILLVRTAPEISNGVATPMSEQFKVTVSSESKATKFKVYYKLETIVFKKGVNVFYGQKEMMPDKINLVTDTSVAQEDRHVIDMSLEVAKKGINLSNYISPDTNKVIVIWYPAKAFEPPSCKQVYKLASRLNLDVLRDNATPYSTDGLRAPSLENADHFRGFVSISNGKVAPTKLVEFYDPVKNKWGSLPKITASTVIKTRLKTKNAGTSIDDSGFNAPSVEFDMVVEIGAIPGKKRDGVINAYYKFPV